MCGIFNKNAANLEDCAYGTSELFPVSCGGKALDQWSGQPFQTPAGNDCDFSSVSSRDGTSPSSRLLDAIVDSYSSSIFSGSVNSPSRSPRQSADSAPTCPNSQQATQSSSPSTFSSASPSPSTGPRSVHCRQCQVSFIDVEPALEHVAANHRGRASRWPCTDSDCSKDFANKKDLQRHLEESQHLDIKFTCACGQVDRRDKHITHIRACQRTRVGFYICRCENKIDILEEHQTHVRDCRQGRPRKKGRPPKTNNESAQRRTDGVISPEASYSSGGSELQ